MTMKIILIKIQLHIFSFLFFSLTPPTYPLYYHQLLSSQSDSILRLKAICYKVKLTLFQFSVKLQFDQVLTHILEFDIFHTLYTLTSALIIRTLILTNNFEMFCHVTKTPWVPNCLAL